MKNTFNTSAALLLLAITLTISCKKTDQSPKSNSGTASITIKVAAELNRIGKTSQAVAEVKDGAGNVLTGKTIQWSLTDNNPISISNTGLVTALAAGTSEIRAFVDNVVGKATITVGANQTAVSKSLGCLCDATDYPGTGNVTFTAPIMKTEDLEIIYPLGYMWKGHVTPIDHQYYYPKNLLAPNPPEFGVYAPADGYIVRVGHTQTQIETHLAPRDNYDIMIQHSCNTYTYLSLITGLPDDMAAAFGNIPAGTSKTMYIKVTAGQQVAKVGGQSLDVGVFDTNAPEKKWIVPEHYTERGKIFVSDPFVYYNASIKAMMLAKNPRTAEPRGGVIGYDIDGKLAGTWFLQNTNGYSGASGQGYDYWRGHLVFAYHTFDPDAVEISIGRWYKPGATDDQARAGWQFAVKGNTPDPKNVTTSSGLVKYELADLTYTVPGGQWDRQTYQGPIKIGAANIVEGVLLVQMIDNRTIKVEAFPGKIASQVTAFTSNAQIYER